MLILLSEERAISEPEKKAEKATHIIRSSSINQKLNKIYLT